MEMTAVEQTYRTKAANVALRSRALTRRLPTTPPLEGCLAKRGRPVAFHSDKHSVLRPVSKARNTGHGVTQFGRALNELDVEILCADSSQAKGRALRANRTLQDRPVGEMRLEGVSDMDAANAFLPGFVERFDRRLAKEPYHPEDLHRLLNVGPDRLQAIVCLRTHRHVGAQLSFRFERRRIILEENDMTCGRAGKCVDTYAFPPSRDIAAQYPAGQGTIGSTSDGGASPSPIGRSARTSA